MSRREWDCILAGVFAPDGRGDGRSPVFINGIGSVQFYLKLMSEPPKSNNLAYVDRYVCYADQLQGFFDDTIAGDDYRIGQLKEYLESRIVLFRPTLSVGADGVYYPKAQPVHEPLAPQAMTEYTRLIPVLYLTETSPAEFEQALLGGGLIAYTETYGRDTPVPKAAAVWVRDYLYGPFKTMQPLAGGWQLAGDHVRRLRVDLNEFESLALPFRNVLFIEADAYSQKLLRELEAEGVPLERSHPVLPVPGPTAAPVSGNGPGRVTVPLPATATVPGAGSVASGPSAAAPVAGAGETRARPVWFPSDLDGELAEWQFLEHLELTARANRLLYRREDLINFHTALKTGCLVLLSGMSGTGKSQLVQVYAQALGLGPGQFRLISVRPTWTDGSDLLGFLDLTHNVYRPADTGLVQLLVEAQRNPDKMFLVCFDEMNLARVEHYFAQFISVLELDAARRFITLYDEEAAREVQNADRFPAQVQVGANIMFVGTVNVDESTYAFSDKVLDRAQVIKPRVLPFTQLPAHLNRPVQAVSGPEVTAGLYSRWCASSQDLELTPEELAYLEEVRAALERVDEQSGIGYRALRHIDAYLKNIPADHDGRPAVARAVAFDWQNVQKVLTKLRGPREQMEGLVGVTDDAGRVSDSLLLDLMDKYGRVSRFDESRRVIHQKARELKVYGYAS